MKNLIVNKTIIVLGAGISGISAIKLCYENNAKKIYVYAEEVENKEELDKLGVELIELEEVYTNLKKAEVVVVSPGFIKNREVMKKIKEVYSVVISEIDLGYILNPKTKYVVITGTNGKSTCTRLIGEYFREKKVSACVGGNIGKSMYDTFNHDFRYDYCILEASAQQLSVTRYLKPLVAVITNITEDHLEEFDNVDDYRESKFNLLKLVGEGGYVILNSKEGEKWNLNNKIAPDTQLHFFYMNESSKANEVFFHNDDIVVKVDGEIKKILPNIRHEIRADFCEVSLIVTMVAFLLLGEVDTATLLKVVSKGKLFEHRLEVVGKNDTTLFINDSKATNPESVCFAMKCYPGACIICGSNNSKKSNFQNMVRVAQEKRVHLVLFDETKEIIIGECQKNGFQDYHVVDSLDIAVKYAMSKKFQYVIFSPGGNSRPTFQGLEMRGKYFKSIVNKLL